MKFADDPTTDSDATTESEVDFNEAHARAHACSGECHDHDHHHHKHKKKEWQIPMLQEMDNDPNILEQELPDIMKWKEMESVKPNTHAKLIDECITNINDKKDKKWKNNYLLLSELYLKQSELYFKVKKPIKVKNAIMKSIKYRKKVFKNLGFYKTRNTFWNETFNKLNTFQEIMKDDKDFRKDINALLES